MKNMLVIMGLILLFATPSLAGNIFIEEGDLFIGSGIEVEFQGDQQELERIHILMAKVTDVEQFKALGLGFDLEPGQKLKLLNKGDGEWDILDLLTEKPLGTISNVIVK